MLIVAVPLVLLGFFRVYSMATQMAFSCENLVLKHAGDHASRVLYLQLAGRARSEQVLVRRGPGSYASTAGLRFGAPLAKMCGMAFAHDVTMVSSTQWPVLLVELGVVGVGLVLLPLRRARLAHARDHPAVAGGRCTRGLALAGVGAVLALLGSGLASRSLEYQLPSLHVWLICGLAAALYAIERESSSPAEQVE